MDGDDFLSLKPVPGTIVNNRTYYNLKLETTSGRSRTLTLNTAKLRKAESIGERVESVLRGDSKKS